MKQSDAFGTNRTSQIEPILDSLNLRLGFGLYLTEEDYMEHIDGKEHYLPRKYLNDYICIVKEGTLNFLHYGPSNLEELRPSKLESNVNLSFCNGLYCYDASAHIPVDVKDSSIYYGTYTGKYVECMYDCDCANSYNNKGEGNLKEYVLLIDSPIRFNKEIKY